MTQAQFSQLKTGDPVLVDHWYFDKHQDCIVHTQKPVWVISKGEFTVKIEDENGKQINYLREQIELPEGVTV